ncbi:hypothetical protein [Streptomyces sp. NPDC059063]|uniref:hypothetical protein n=1 Tax=unclassified Streptomyces TaxID=2593676 RepID=UPI0036A69DED
MRDAIARALVWVFVLLSRARRAEPGRHTARYLADRQVTEGWSTTPLQSNPAAVWFGPWRTPSAETVRDIFHAEEAQDLTPDQRERWRAAAFSEIGVEYDFDTINITPVRAVSA